MELFTPDGNICWKVMPMGDLNSDPILLAMMTKLQMEWETQANERGLKNVVSKIIIHDVLLYGCTAKHILAYFRTVLNILNTTVLH